MKLHAAVRWLTPARDIAALVTETGESRFAAELFHFGKTPRKMTAELYLLKEGAYRFRIEPVGTGSSVKASTSIIRVTGKRTRVAFTLPARVLCQLSVSALEDPK